ncbi:MAG: hypothetical protein US60_C0015G0053 [Microgenomates group bacterium GW2011_GWC1_37_8]|uniref:DNA alkylation repair protein n=1 Tax=Candidatus Woesebacteria bacterium GW2011_GWB1_38_8 TaxID=1618570 RepID=A0A0G0L514_9BACT|nr:MAG: hypothetical protein US60_C0015G0053 [Microgenomates group bacterium GW2011_GWC1_37_8]KKQ86092.1 MAG: hypothetical protein UT08_C0002G0114 [Candidatus Woesebacteria bacterium GW2011_GWB1_38_8]
MNYDQVIKRLKSLKNPKNVEGMARFGINPKNTLGISIYVLRPLAKEISKNHNLALNLWKSSIHEARILASYIDEVDKVTEAQMDEWVADFDSWDICDQVISNLFDQTPHAYKKAFEWSKRKPEFEKRAGFVMMAALSVHDKSATDAKLLKFFPVIKREATDGRNFVRKAVNWSLRNIGKRNRALNKQAIIVAKVLAESEDKTARWIGKDALRELTSKKVQARLA